jgi:hypothetical protein
MPEDMETITRSSSPGAGRVLAGGLIGRSVPPWVPSLYEMDMYFEKKEDPVIVAAQRVSSSPRFLRGTTMNQSIELTARTSLWPNQRDRGEDPGFAFERRKERRNARQGRAGQNLEYGIC